MAKKTAKPKPAHEGWEGGPIKVAIVGGGCAGMAAAWQFAKRSDCLGKDKPQYEVTVFERSWRLGGKGASGRDEDGHIIEHGLHVWMGFYENAFRMMRECYAEIGSLKEKGKPPGPVFHESFETAFFPEPHLGVSIGGKCHPWDFWSGMLPATAGTPGDPLDEDTNPFTVSNYLSRCFVLLKALYQSVVDAPDAQAPGGARPNERSSLDEAIEADFAFDPMRTPEAFIDTMTRYARTGMLTTAAGLMQAFGLLEMWSKRMGEGAWAAESTLNLLQAIAKQMQKQMGDVVAIDPKLRWKTEILDIVMAIAVGLYRDRVLFSEKGLDAINHLDYRDWLKRNGAATAYTSPFITGIYDLTFAYRDGDRKQPALAAGVALRGALRMFFTCRGSMFWRMRSGMGEAVFGPLYRVLESRGVKFEFLHDLKRIDFTPGDERTRFVEQLVFEAALPDKKRDPLDNAGCWSHEAPKASKTVPKVLKIGEHFDAVILALGIEDVRTILDKDRAIHAESKPANGNSKARSKAKATLGDAMPAKWRDALRYYGTVATVSAQVWLAKDLPELGWHRGPCIVTGMNDGRFQTWADMTHTVTAERSWRGLNKTANAAVPSDGAKSVAYFCGVVQDNPRPEKRVSMSGEKRLSMLASFVAESMPAVWPAAFEDGKLREKSLLRKPVVVVNHSGSDRYTLSLPGTLQHRLSPLDDWIANMSVAGDWTACGLDAGCIESAVMSGMLAAYAITNDEPKPESIVGYDHP